MISVVIDIVLVLVVALVFGIVLDVVIGIVVDNDTDTDISGSRSGTPRWTLQTFTPPSLPKYLVECSEATTSSLVTKSAILFALPSIP